MPRPTITPEKRAETRKRIREVATRLSRKKAAESGATASISQSITVREIADEAGISVGTFYTYFESIAALAQSIWREPVEARLQVIRRDIASIDDPTERVRFLLGHYVGLAIDNPRMFRAAMLYVRPDNVERKPAEPLEDQEFYGFLSAALAEGQDRGDFGEFDVREMAQLVWAAIHGALATPVNLERIDFQDSEQLATAMIDQVVELIRKDAPKREARE